MLLINYNNNIKFHHEQEHEQQYHIRRQKFQNEISLIKHKTSKLALIFAMLYSFSWLLLYAVYNKKH